MENFLEKSTIHGVGHISSNRNFARIFWSLVVISGFTGAGVLIYQSFQDWADNPVTTTIETIAMENNDNIKFPKITVCPPKKTYTDLNYDLIMIENTTMNTDTRNELTTFASELLHDLLFKNIMKLFSKLEENNRYYNWYYGYTKMIPPDTNYDGYDINYVVYTASTSGSVTTQYINETFDAEMVESSIYYSVIIFPPYGTGYNNNVTLNLDIQIVPLENNNERFYVDYDLINHNIKAVHKNFSPPLGKTNITNLLGVLGKSFLTINYNKLSLCIEILPFLLTNILSDCSFH